MLRLQFSRNIFGLSTQEAVEMCDPVLLQPQLNAVIFSLKPEDSANPVVFIA